MNAIIQINLDSSVEKHLFNLSRRHVLLIAAKILQFFKLMFRQFCEIVTES